MRNAMIMVACLSLCACDVWWDTGAIEPEKQASTTQPTTQPEVEPCAMGEHSDVVDCFAQADRKWQCCIDRCVEGDGEGPPGSGPSSCHIACGDEYYDITDDCLEDYTMSSPG